MRGEDPAELIERNRNKGVLVDANILLLLIIGTVDRNLVQNFRGTQNQGFTPEDYDLLLGILGYFQRLLTTPHILTEVSNHSDKLKGQHAETCRVFLAQLFTKMDERYQPSKELCQSEAFPRFGLTDTAIFNLAPGQCLVLTTDFKLTGVLEKNGVDVLNYNQLRSLIWAK